MFPEWRIMYKAFLIKYGEIGVKGKNRYLFEDALVRQIRYALKKTDGEFEVTKENGRIYATAVSDFDFDEAVEALKTVFGIIGICRLYRLKTTDLMTLPILLLSISTPHTRISIFLLRSMPDVQERITRWIPWKSTWKWAEDY